MSSDDDLMFDTDSEYDHQATYRRVRIRHGVHQDQGRRRVMEDFHIIENQFTDLVAREIKSISEAPLYFPLNCNSLYFGLFDGHAGAAAAEFCQQNLHRNIARSIPISADIGEAMIKGFELTDKEFLEFARRNNEESGSVCVSAILIGDTLHIAHTGDSRAVLCRNGQAIHLTSDHKPTCHKEKERVVQNGGTIEWNLLNGYLEVSRAIGDFDRELGLKTRGLSASPEITKVTIHPDDEFVIVACDGLWDVIDSSGAIRFARAHLARYNCVETASEFLVREALRKQSDDNITVLIIGFQKQNPATGTGRFVPYDAVVDDLPAYVLDYFDQEEYKIPEPTPTSSRRRPRFCAKGLAHIQKLLP